jgi:hypothetical protein
MACWGGCLGLARSSAVVRALEAPMKDTELLDTVLLIKECFFLIQEIDERWRRNNPHAIALLQEIYKNRSMTFDFWHPLFQIKTGVPLLFVPVSYALQLDDHELILIGEGLKNNSYHIQYQDDNAKRVPTPRDILRTIRNAIAHLPDFEGGKCLPNVSFDNGAVRFISVHPRNKTSADLLFDNAEGLVNFVQDLLKVVNNAVIRGYKTKTPSSTLRH